MNKYQLSYVLENLETADKQAEEYIVKYNIPADIAYAAKYGIVISIINAAIPTIKQAFELVENPQTQRELKVGDIVRIISHIEDNCHYGKEERIVEITSWKDFPITTISGDRPFRKMWAKNEVELA